MALDTLKSFLANELMASKAEERLLANPRFQEELKGLGLSNETAAAKLKEFQDQRKLDAFTDDLISKTAEMPDVDMQNLDPTSKSILEFAERQKIDPLVAKNIVKFRKQIPFDLASRQVNNPKYEKLMKTIYPELARSDSQSSYDAEGRIKTIEAEGRERRKTSAFEAALEKDLINARNQGKLDLEASKASNRIFLELTKGNIANAKNLFNSQLNVWEDMQRKGTLSPKDALLVAQNYSDTIDALADQMSGNGWFSTTGAAKEFKDKAKNLLDQQKFGELSNLIQGINKQTVIPAQPTLDRTGNIIDNQNDATNNNSPLNKGTTDYDSIFDNNEVKYKGKILTKGIWDNLSEDVKAQILRLNGFIR